MLSSKKQIHISILFLIIFLSGISFLIFEVSWFRMLALIIGSTSSSSAIVLSGYLSGMGLGAYYFGKYRCTFPIWILFVGIAVLAFGNYFFVKFTIPFFYQTVPFFSPQIIKLVGYVLTILVVFLPAFLMGGVFPLIAQSMKVPDVEKNSKLAKLYAFETLGSVIGGLITGFFLIKTFGQFYTISIAIAILFSLAIITFVYRKCFSLKSHSTRDIDLGNDVKINGVMKSNNWQIAFLTTFVCGFVVVSMQTIWFRFFKVYFVNTSYTFAIISSSVVFGLYLGSWFYSVFEKKIINKVKTIFKILLCLSFAAIVGLIITIYLPSLLIIPLAVMEEDYLVRIILIPILTAVLVIVPVSAISGFCMPLTWSLVTKSDMDTAESTGKILFANSLGSVLGPLLTIFVFIPIFGNALSVVFPVFLSGIVALWIVYKNFFPQKKILFSFSMLLFSFFAIIILSIKPIVRVLPPSFNKYDKEIIAYGETIEGSYVVGKDRDTKNPVLTTYVNNSSVIGSTYDAIKAVKMVGNIPFLMGLDCENALVVGFGIGVTTSAIASNPKVKHIDCVELMPDLKNVAHFYSDLNKEVYNDPRLKIYGGDGRHFLQTTQNKYDLISSDPTHPILGSGNIYTKEYFELCKNHLTQNGMISQYLPLHKLRLSDLLGIVKTFYSVFSDATVWIAQYHAILIGSNSGNSVPIDFRRWKYETQNLQNDDYFYNNPYHLAASLIFTNEQIEENTANITINTDDKSYLEFFSFDAFKTINLIDNLTFLNQHRGGINSAFVNVEDPKLFSKFIYANQLFTEGVIEMLRENQLGYKFALKKAIEVNPENQEFPFLLKLLFNEN